MLGKKPPARVQQILERAGPPSSDTLSYELERQIRRSVLAMGLPSIASFFLLTVYDLIDIFWLARLGQEPVAAVTVFGSLLWLLSFPNQIIGTGSVALISRRFGEADLTGTERAIKNTFLGKFLIGTVMGGLGLLILPEALALFGTEPEVVRLAVAYGRIPCLGLGVSLASFSVYTALRGVGRPTLGMWSSVVGTVVNVILDPLLIFGIGPFPRMGIVGAAVASLAGFLAVTILGMSLLASPLSPVRVRWFRGPHPGGRSILTMARIGLPSGLSSLSFSLSGTVIVKLVAIYGTSVVALFGMSQKVLHLGMVVISGFGLGTSALIGQYLGSRELHKAWLAAKLNARTVFTTMVLFALGIAVAAPWIVRAFFDDPALVGPGALYLRLLALGMPFFALTSAGEQPYAGAGRNMPPMIMQVAITWGLVIPMMILAGQVLGLGPAWMMGATSAARFLGSGVGLWLMTHGGWLEHRV
jgi:putative MATE family efflux protein